MFRKLPTQKVISLIRLNISLFLCALCEKQNLRGKKIHWSEITAGKAYLAVGGCFTPSWFSQRPQRNRDFFVILLLALAVLPCFKITSSHLSVFIAKLPIRRSSGTCQHKAISTCKTKYISVPLRALRETKSPREKEPLERDYCRKSVPGSRRVFHAKLFLTKATKEQRNLFQQVSSLAFSLVVSKVVSS